MKPYFNFEHLNKTEAGKLLGGFSEVLAANANDDDLGDNKMCNHANCKVGCSHSNKKGKTKNQGSCSNVNCGAGKNCAVGCDNKKVRKYYI